MSVPCQPTLESLRGIVVYVKNLPSGRVICLCYNLTQSDEIRLFIKSSDNNEPQSSSIECSSVVIAENLDSTFPAGYEQINNMPFLGLLGCFQHDHLTYLLFISKAIPVAISLQSSVYQISHAEAISLVAPKYDLISFIPWTYSLSENSSEKSVTCLDILRVLSDGSFYFSISSNISLTIQEKLSLSDHANSCISHFCWSEYLNEPFVSFCRSNPSISPRLLEAFSSVPFRFHIIRGYIGQFIINLDPESLNKPSIANASLDAVSLKKTKYSINSMFRSSISSALRLASSRLGISTSMSYENCALKDSSAFPTLASVINEDELIDSSNSFILISRVGSKRAGTRFLTRGVDDDGNTANFVETEMILETVDKLFSFISVRGSVPIFWEQQGLQFGNPRIQFTRSLEASDPSFKAHFSNLVQLYSSPIYIINLLSSDINQQENSLSRRFYRHVQLLKKNLLENVFHYIPFDMNSVLDGISYDSLSAIVSSVVTFNMIDDIGFLIYDKNEQSIILKQKGIFRINCLDCLDRTNVIQSLISQMVLKRICLQIKDDLFVNATASQSFSSKFNAAWADNGDFLSLLYTGTGALKSGFTRTGRRTLAGIVDDLKKSTQRFYINTFQDKYRQKLIDMILGKGPPKIHLISETKGKGVSSMQQTEKNDAADGSLYSNLLIYSCTYNVGGVSPEIINFGALLRPLWKFCNDRHPDLLVISLQEAMELSPHQILTSDDISLAMIWEEHISKYLGGFFPKVKYVFLSSIQMVGLVMITIVRRSLIPYIRKVERFVKKAGFGGVTGNKGSIALRFDLLDSHVSFCFINSHFSSGQENETMRNREFFSVYNDTKFPSGLSIDCHTNIIWMGDLNYRIDLPLDNFKIQSPSLKWFLSLLSYDQLLKEKNAGTIFDSFVEAPITFPPTYKFISLSESYDLSSRVPSWTDRILFCSKKMKIITYDWLEDMISSDHRPVAAIFEYNQNLNTKASQRPSPSKVDHTEKLNQLEKLIDADNPFKIESGPFVFSVQNNDQSWENWKA